MASLALTPPRTSCGHLSGPERGGEEQGVPLRAAPMSPSHAPGWEAAPSPARVKGGWCQSHHVHSLGEAPGCAQVVSETPTVRQSRMEMHSAEAQPSINRPLYSPAFMRRKKAQQNWGRRTFQKCHRETSVSAVLCLWQEALHGRG